MHYGGLWFGDIRDTGLPKQIKSMADGTPLDE